MTKQVYLITFTGDNSVEYINSFTQWQSSLNTSDVTVEKVENFPVSSVTDIAA